MLGVKINQVLIVKAIIIDFRVGAISPIIDRNAAVVCVIIQNKGERSQTQMI